MHLPPPSSQTYEHVMQVAFPAASRAAGRHMKLFSWDTLVTAQILSRTSLSRHPAGEETMRASFTPTRLMPSGPMHASFTTTWPMTSGPMRASFTLTRGLSSPVDYPHQWIVLTDLHRVTKEVSMPAMRYKSSRLRNFNKIMMHPPCW